MRERRRRLRVLANGLIGPAVITAVITAVLAAGCTAHSTTVGSGSPGSTANSSTANVSTASISTANVSTQRSPSVTASPTAARAIPVSTKQSSATATAECSANALRITAISGGGAGGHEGEILRFTNVGAATCFVRGYPGVAEFDRQDHLIQNAVRTPDGYLGGLGTPRGAPRVTLRPGDTAAALAEAVDNFPVPGYRSCADAGATHLLVTAPDQTAATLLPVLLSACNTFQIHPITASADGSEP
jgi:hypothetical protein